MTQLETLLALAHPPVAITFCDQPPAGIARVAGPAPAGCGYWRRAAEGEVFYTAAPDHLGCPVGAHTHNVPMPIEKQQELEGMVGTMIGLDYLTMADVGALPRRATPLAYAVYAPLAQSPLAPDVVLVRGDVRQLMLLTEAAQSAGLGSEGPTMGRPTCAVLPNAINTARTSSSFGCVGNRVYTGAGDHEGYFAIPGDKLDVIVARLEVIVRANQALDAFHQSRNSA